LRRVILAGRHGSGLLRHYAAQAVQDADIPVIPIALTARRSLHRDSGTGFTASAAAAEEPKPRSRQVRGPSACERQKACGKNLPPTPITKTEPKKEDSKSAQSLKRRAAFSKNPILNPVTP
jgi:hypothetical protein